MPGGSYYSTLAPALTLTLTLTPNPNLNPSPNPNPNPSPHSNPTPTPTPTPNQAVCASLTLAKLHCELEDLDAHLVCKRDELRKKQR